MLSSDSAKTAWLAPIGDLVVRWYSGIPARTLKLFYEFVNLALVYPVMFLPPFPRMMRILAVLN